MMQAFDLLDGFALAFFVLAWIAYHIAVETPMLGRLSLNQAMHSYRRVWMESMLKREPRIIDTQIMASLQNGTAFFASTSLFAVGGALTFLRATDDVLHLFSDFPLGPSSSRIMWELKVAGLVVVFIYAFFKFAWAYRLFNYAAILLGGTPPPSEANTQAARDHIIRLGEMVTDAGRQFNRGQRAFFFALAYVGWFVSPILLFGTTTAALIVMAQRQFASPAHNAVTFASVDELDKEEG